MLTTYLACMLLHIWYPQQACASCYQATATGFFLLLVLVPLIAFSIRCLIGAFNNKVGVNESKKHHLGPKSKRWRSALSDLREPDIFVGDSKSSSSVSTFI